MKIISLVENTTRSELKAKHGLSLYIETKKHKILFDLGPDKTLFENAVKRNIDISKVDTVIISHGHIDHGGALKSFLEVNSSAKIYVQRTAFEPHYSKTLFIKIPVGIDAAIKGNKQIVLLDGDYKIDDELLLFTVIKQTDFIRLLMMLFMTIKEKTNSDMNRIWLFLKIKQRLLWGVDMPVLSISWKKQKNIAPICVWEVIIYSIRLQRKRYRRNC